jgi:hypothetical protein
VTAPPGRTSYRPAAPRRGVPGGWRDWWDEPDDCAELQAKAEVIERRFAVTAERLGQIWQTEIREERRQAPHRAPLANQAGKTGAVAILPLKIEAEMPPHHEDLLWRRLSLGQTFATLTKFWNFEMKQFGDT